MAGNIRSADEKFNIIMGSLKTDVSIIETGRKYGISVSQFYKWKEQFFEGDKSELGGKSAHNEFEKENDKLKHLIGEQTMIIEALKNTTMMEKMMIISELKDQINKSRCKKCLNLYGRDRYD